MNLQYFAAVSPSNNQVCCEASAQATMIALSFPESVRHDIAKESVFVENSFEPPILRVTNGLALRLDIW